MTRKSAAARQTHQKPEELQDIETNAFLREVDEAMHLDRMKSYWNQYKFWLLGAIFAVFAISAGKHYYVISQHEQAMTEAELFMNATVSDSIDYVDGQQGEIVDYQLLQSLADTGKTGYALIAKFKLAEHNANTAEITAASELYNSISSDNSVDKVYQHLANLYHAQMLMADNQNPKAKSLLATLVDEKAPFKFSALEMFGYISEKEGNYNLAIEFYNRVIDNNLAPAGIVERTKARVEMIRREYPLPAKASN